MNSYGKLWEIYREASTWESFISLVARGRGKRVLLEATGAGWHNRIRRDLLERFDVPTEEVDLLLVRYGSIARATPSSTSVAELTAELGRIEWQARTLKGYMRRAYYVERDEPDDVVWTIDRVLFSLTQHTPTPTECAESYTLVTGKIVNPGAVVLDGEEASEVATYVAIQIEDMQRRFPYLTEGREDMVARMKRLDDIHSALTGKSLLGSEALAEKILSSE